MRPRASRMAAREADAMPLPRDETTPPVTNTYLVMLARPQTLVTPPPRDTASGAAFGVPLASQPFLPAFGTVAVRQNGVLEVAWRKGSPPSARLRTVLASFPAYGSKLMPGTPGTGIHFISVRPLLLAGTPDVAFLSEFPTASLSGVSYAMYAVVAVPMNQP